MGSIKPGSSLWIYSVFFLVDLNLELALPMSVYGGVKEMV